jgi:hypothetical protein
MRRTGFLLVFFSMTLLANTAAQTPFELEDFDARPLADARENYFDLIAKITGGATGRDEKSKSPLIDDSFELRRLVINEGDEKTTEYDAPLVVRDGKGLWFEAKGAKHLALLLEIAARAEDGSEPFEWQYVLAVFRVRPALVSGGEKSEGFELTDAVDPQTDRFTWLTSEFPLIETDAPDQAFWILNEHWNSSQSFSVYELVRLDAKNRLSLAIENLPGVFSDGDCSANAADTFRVARRNRRSRKYLPYDFVFKTFRWTRKQCEKDAKISYPVEETRIYRAAWTTAKRRRALRLRLVLFAKKRAKYVRAN